MTAGFNTSGEKAKLLLSTAWRFKIAAHRVFTHAKAMPILPATKIAWKSTFREVARSAIPNRRYADSAIILVMGIYEACRELGIDFRDVELGEWLMFQQSEKEWPPRNITLKRLDEVWVTTFDYDGTSRRIRLTVSTSGIFRKLLKALLDEKQPYNPRIYIKSWNMRQGTLYVRGQLQVAIPYSFYVAHAARYRRNRGSLYAGVDVNTDRINLAIVDSKGWLRNVKTFWFREVTARGYPRHRARSVIGMRVHEMLKHAYHNGVKTLFLEDPGVLGRLKFLWIRGGKRKSRNYNYKVSVFRSSTIEMIAMKAPLYAINTRYVSPRGTTNSEEHDEVMRRYGLDKHTASAYIVALRGLGYA